MFHERLCEVEWGEHVVGCGEVRGLIPTMPVALVWQLQSLFEVSALELKKSKSTEEIIISYYFVKWLNLNILKNFFLIEVDFKTCSHLLENNDLVWFSH